VLLTNNIFRCHSSKAAITTNSQQARRILDQLFISLKTTKQLASVTIRSPILSFVDAIAYADTDDTAMSKIKVEDGTCHGRRVHAVPQ
jgi:hypothetical protein